MLKWLAICTLTSLLRLARGKWTIIMFDVVSAERFPPDLLSVKVDELVSTRLIGHMHGLTSWFSVGTGIITKILETVN